MPDSQILLVPPAGWNAKFFLNIEASPEKTELEKLIEARLLAAWQLAKKELNIVTGTDKSNQLVQSRQEKARQEVQNLKDYEATVAAINLQRAPLMNRPLTETEELAGLFVPGYNVLMFINDGAGNLQKTHAALKAGLPAAALGNGIKATVDAVWGAESVLPFSGLLLKGVNKGTTLIQNLFRKQPLTRVSPLTVINRGTMGDYLAQGSEATVYFDPKTQKLFKVSNIDAENGAAAFANGQKYVDARNSLGFQLPLTVEGVTPSELSPGKFNVVYSQKRVKPLPNEKELMLDPDLWDDALYGHITPYMSKFGFQEDVNGTYKLIKDGIEYKILDVNPANVGMDELGNIMPFDFDVVRTDLATGKVFKKGGKIDNPRRINYFK